MPDVKILIILSDKEHSIRRLYYHATSQTVINSSLYKYAYTNITSVKTWIKCELKFVALLDYKFSVINKMSTFFLNISCYIITQ